MPHPVMNLLRIPHLASIVSPIPHPAKPMLDPQFRDTKTKKSTTKKIIHCDYGVFVITQPRLRKHRPIFNSFSRTMTSGTIFLVITLFFVLVKSLILTFSSYFKVTYYEERMLEVEDELSRVKEDRRQASIQVFLLI